MHLQWPAHFAAKNKNWTLDHLQFISLTIWAYWAAVVAKWPYLINIVYMVYHCFRKRKTDLLCGMFFYDWNLSPTNDLHRYGWCVIGAEWRILPDNIRGHLIFQPCSFALKIHKGICLKSTFLTFNCFGLGQLKDIYNIT